MYVTFVYVKGLLNPIKPVQAGGHKDCYCPRQAVQAVSGVFNAEML